MHYDVKIIYDISEIHSVFDVNCKKLFGRLYKRRHDALIWRMRNG